MPKETRFDPLPVSFGNARAIAAPFQFVTTGEDNLRVTVVNSTTGVRVAIQGRRIDDAGVILPLAHSITPTADRLPLTRVFPLGVGALVNLTAFAVAGAPAFGQTYVIVELVRGREGGIELLATLLAGYVTTTQSIGWPGSPIQASLDGPGYVRQFQGTQPISGSDVAEFVPTGARWELLSISCELFCDGTVVTRTPRLVLNGVYGNFMSIAASQGATAGQNIRYSFTSGFGAPGVFAGLQNQNPLPIGLPVMATTGIYLVAVNMQPNDVWGLPSIYIREWIEV